MNYSKTLNSTLMAQARQSLQGKWGLVIGVVIINFLVGMISIIPFFGWIASIIICPVVYVGLMTFTLSISREKKGKIEQLFEPLNDGGMFGTAIAATLLQAVLIMLGIICLIIPGIYLAFSFKMTMLIIADNPTIGPLDALKKSHSLMNGNKMKYFFMMCRFIGWFILATCTFGVGFLWLVPYVHISDAKFYDDILKSQNTTERIEEEPNHSELTE